MIDLGNDHEPVALFAHRPGRRLLVAAGDGRGFFVPEDDVVAQTRSGRQVLNPAEGAEAIVCVDAAGDTVAVVGSNRRLLVFPAAEVPTMARGRGVILQRYSDAALSDVQVFDSGQGLRWRSGAGVRTETALDQWRGKRGQAGRAAPRGFRRPTASSDGSTALDARPHLTPTLSSNLFTSLSRRALAPRAWLGGGEGEMPLPPAFSPSALRGEGAGGGGHAGSTSRREVRRHRRRNPTTSWPHLLRPSTPFRRTRFTWMPGYPDTRNESGHDGMRERRAATLAAVAAMPLERTCKGELLAGIGVQQTGIGLLWGGLFFNDCVYIGFGFFNNGRHFIVKKTIYSSHWTKSLLHDSVSRRTSLFRSSGKRAWAASFKTRQFSLVFSYVMGLKCRLRGRLRHISANSIVLLRLSKV